MRPASISPALAVLRRGQQPHDNRLIRVEIEGTDECRHFIGPGRNAYKIEVDTADQGRVVSISTKAQLSILERLLNEPIDRSSNAPNIVWRRWCYRCQRRERPVICLRTGLVDFGESGELCGSQFDQRGSSRFFSSTVSGSSGFGGISSVDTSSQSVLSSGLPGTITAPFDPPRASERGTTEVELPLRFERAVTFQTPRLQERQDITFQIRTIVDSGFGGQGWTTDHGENSNQHS